MVHTVIAYAVKIFFIVYVCLLVSGAVVMILKAILACFYGNKNASKSHSGKTDKKEEPYSAIIGVVGLIAFTCGIAVSIAFKWYIPDDRWRSNRVDGFLGIRLGEKSDETIKPFRVFGSGFEIRELQKLPDGRVYRIHAISYSDSLTNVVKFLEKRHGLKPELGSTHKGKPIYVFRDHRWHTRMIQVTYWGGVRLFMTDKDLETEAIEAERNRLSTFE